ASRTATASVQIYDIIPFLEANCDALMDGTAVPGDSDYLIEDQILITLPDAAGARPLTLPEEGRRLFFAQALDADGQVILRGCNDFVAGSSDGEVVIALEPVGAVCEVDVDCDDGNPCTTDTCNDGDCVNANVADGSPCDDGNPCTTDTCNDGDCVNANVADGSPCDDEWWCNGDETCQAGTCQAGSRDCSDTDVCTQDICDDDLNQCLHPPVTEPPDTEGPVDDPSCSDGLDNDCDGNTDADDTECMSCNNPAQCNDDNDCTADDCVDGACVNTAVGDGTGCDDGFFCTDGDTCTGGMCSGPAMDCSASNDDCNVGVCNEDSDACEGAPVPEFTVCEDGLFCTVDDACDAAGACVAGATSPCVGECDASCDEGNRVCVLAAEGTPCTDNGLFCDGAETCDLTGACLSAGDPCGSGQCASCSESEHCIIDDGANCDDGDGVACTVGICQADASCVGTLDDNECAGGETCRPDCFTAATGCGTAPSSLVVSCQSPMSLGGGDGDTSDCVLTASGGDVNALDACLSCSPTLGRTVISVADFDDGAGVCDLDGWSFLTGNLCKNKRANDCTVGGPAHTCCDELATICDTTTYGQPVLAADRDVACGGEKQFRLVGSFDVSGLDNPTLCYDVATIGSATPSGLMLFADAGDATGNLLDCIEGATDSEGSFYRRCVDLTPEVNAGWVDLNFVVHSDKSGERVLLDNIVIFGWAGACAPNDTVVYTDNFDACDFSDWTVSGLSCVDTDCATMAGTAGFMTGTGSMSTVVDASTLDGGVEVCFIAGQTALDAGDDLSFWFDSGSGPVTAWGWAGSVTADGDCYEFCVDLSAFDPDVRNHPALEIGFDMTANSSLALYRVSVMGAAHCTGTNDLVLSSLTGDGSGNYDFTAMDGPGTQLDGLVHCQFDPDTTVEAVTHVIFTP
ncbi:MAG: hypothetical protein JRF33_10775, partial [Deltaproteobacteria bacterium]|nr:hypothetical protein [Deltaproteobacteria bacterium]